jgi:hypothetical protein
VRGHVCLERSRRNSSFVVCIICSPNDTGTSSLPKRVYTHTTATMGVTIMRVVIVSYSPTDTGTSSLIKRYTLTAETLLGVWLLYSVHLMIVYCQQ